MERVTCAFCGLPFRVRSAPTAASHYCCSGCALASRIPVGAEGLPISRGLIIALVLGFGLFNQVLFAALGAATAAEGRLDEAGLFLLVANILGGLLTVACIGFVVTAARRRVSDGVMVAAGILAAAGATVRGLAAGAAQGAVVLLVVNFAFAAWLSRGWLRRAWARRKLSRPQSS